MTAVLYDAPGPRARRRNLVLEVVAVVALLAVAGFVIYRFAVTGQFDAEVWQWILYKNIQLLLLDALLNTLRAFAVAAVLALVFGAVFAAGRLSDHRWLSGPATAVVEFFRAVPLLLLMLFVFYFWGINRGSFGAYWSVVTGLVLYNGAVVAEIVRAGMGAVPHGQVEAAYALGLRKGARFFCSSVAHRKDPDGTEAVQGPRATGSGIAWEFQGSRHYTSVPSSFSHSRLFFVHFTT